MYIYSRGAHAPGRVYSSCRTRFHTSRTVRSCVWRPVSVADGPAGLLQLDAVLSHKAEKECHIPNGKVESAAESNIFNGRGVRVLRGIGGCDQAACLQENGDTRCDVPTHHTWISQTELWGMKRSMAKERTTPNNHLPTRYQMTP